MPDDADSRMIDEFTGKLIRLNAIAKLALTLCRELQCPAMEYLPKNVQDTWAQLYNLCEGKPVDQGLTT